MSEFDTAPALTRPLRAVVRYWPMSLAISLLGLVLGIGVGSARTPIYTAEVRLAIGGQNLSSYAIPGFALAAQELAADYARYVSLPEDESALKAALGARAGEVVGLSASPVPNSSIVSIVALAADQEIAKKAATTVGTTLISAVNGQTNDAQAASLLKQYETLSNSVAQANQALQLAQQQLAKLTAVTTSTPSQLAAAQQAEVDASTKFASLQLQQNSLGSRYQSVATADTPSSNLNVVQPAAIILSNTTKNEELFGLIGLAGGGAFALVAATLRARRRHRRKEPRNDDGDIVPRDTKLQVRPPSFGRKTAQAKNPARVAASSKSGGRDGGAVGRR